jgi:hypothetical protein
MFPQTPAMEKIVPCCLNWRSVSRVSCIDIHDRMAQCRGKTAHLVRSAIGSTFGRAAQLLAKDFDQSRQFLLIFQQFFATVPLLLNDVGRGLGYKRLIF